MIAPSPLPWKIVVEEDWDGATTRIVHAGGYSVACDTSYYPTGLNAADAPIIVRAVNNFDAMLAALKNARTMLTAFGGDPRKAIAEHGSAAGDEIQAALLDEIDAAISKAEAEPTPTAQEGD